MLCCAVTLMAQDVMRLSERDILGTARYVGMAGAMTAVGGDPSAALDNPAGLGLYRRMEITASLGIPIVKYRMMSGTDWKSDFNVHFGQASFVFAFTKPDRDWGIVSNNLMFSYQRLRDFRNRYVAESGQNIPLADVIVDKTYGLYPHDVGNGDRWDNSNVGWISNLGYDVYAINPSLPDSSQWEPGGTSHAPIRSKLQVIESGYVNSYNVTYGMNVSNRFYWGVGINMLSISFRHEELFSEVRGSDVLDLQSRFSISGVGVNGTFGLLYRPIEWVRLGASFQTPSIATLNVMTYGEMKSNYSGKYESSQTPDGRLRWDKCQLPMRLSLGAALQFRQYGLLSLQYDYSAWRDLQARHVFKIGAEAVLPKNLYLNAGYAFESTFAADALRVELDCTSIRTDTDFQNDLQRQFASVAFGYRGIYSTIQLAYQFGWKQMMVHAHEQALPVDMLGLSHLLVLTYNWHLTR